ncbi:MAG: pyruvate, phosphate dikinase [Candidatus Kapabacteria bacterium]|nr:pyruvate, phosphate dikinase [Ignavibacteriota bacterium]MCW5884224.1 pyruvate, phosphate dikinase [Candidatus Kapabacteria bacterium]
MSKDKKVAKKSVDKTKYVYYFGGKKADGTAEMKSLLGGKGANLAEMINMKLPVPPGFTITTEVCTHYYKNGKNYPKSLEEQVKKAIKKVEKEMGAEFGSSTNPLLLSVRSGARASMPGMMDTILNLGLNEAAVQGLIAKSGNERFAYDSYRRFVAMYGDVVMGLKPETKDDIDPFEEILEAKKHARGITLDVDFTAEDLKELVAEYKAAIKKITGQDFPEDPWEQLWGSVGAVFNSWMNERAIVYRKLNNIPEEWGTAVNIQAMVFGNMGETSGTGVAFTRDAASGENYFYGEFLMNAQGEDVVAGTRTPYPIIELKDIDEKSYNGLMEIREILEQHYRDMLDVEFTIQDKKLYMLQCRVGKRTAFAAMKIAVDMVNEGLIKPQEALMRIEPDQLNQLLRPIFDLNAKGEALKNGALLTKGLNAGPGAASGKVVFNAEDAVAWKAKGDDVILVRIETSPEDIAGMNASEGILTARGGMTSHAALVARQMGKVCVAGCGALQIDYKTRQFKVEGKDVVVKEGDYISIDGSTGEVINGNIPTKPSEVIEVLISGTLDPKDAPTYQIYKQIMDWADQFRTLKVRTNADQPDQSSNAISFGAEGIGLCRTEHMFFGDGKIQPMREMILAENVEARRLALSKLLPLQREDFEGIFLAMDGKPVTIRTIDPPLHEFLPHDDAGQKEVAKELGVTAKAVKERVEALHEFNPMLGFRGCRLGLIFPEITEMQARAIFEATVNVLKEGKSVLPEVMIPLVGHVKELRHQEQIVRKTAEAVMQENNCKFDYLVGTMIEIPRGAITAGEIAEVAEFFSFGTNDLTQTTLGLSRDDAGKFLPEYVSREIYNVDPFVSIDRTGVGFLMHHAVREGQDTRPGIKLGICGEHGGDPASVEFCHSLGLNYVSCSPFRVPIARLAAARAAIRDMQVSGKPSKKDAKKAEKKAKAEKKSGKKKSDKKTDKKKKK